MVQNDLSLSGALSLFSRAEMHRGLTDHHSWITPISPKSNHRRGKSSTHGPRKYWSIESPCLAEIGDAALSNTGSSCQSARAPRKTLVKVEARRMIRANIRGSCLDLTNTLRDSQELWVSKTSVAGANPAQRQPNCDQQWVQKIAVSSALVFGSGG